MISRIVNNQKNTCKILKCRWPFATLPHLFTIYELEWELPKYLRFIFTSSSTIIMMNHPFGNYWLHIIIQPKKKVVLIKLIYIASEWGKILSKFHGEIIYVLMYSFDKYDVYTVY